eukprot:2383252-Rhodomonas_salina.1
MPNQKEAAELDTVKFRVSPHLNKFDIRQWIEAGYDTPVEKVNTINYEGRLGRKQGGRTWKRPDYKYLAKIGLHEIVPFPNGGSAKILSDTCFQDRMAVQDSDKTCTRTIHRRLMKVSATSCHSVVETKSCEATKPTRFAARKLYSPPPLPPPGPPLPPRPPR